VTAPVERVRCAVCSMSLRGDQLCACAYGYVPLTEKTLDEKPKPRLIGYAVLSELGTLRPVVYALRSYAESSMWTGDKLIELYEVPKS